MRFLGLDFNTWLWIGTALFVAGLALWPREDETDDGIAELVRKRLEQQREIAADVSRD